MRLGSIARQAERGFFADVAVCAAIAEVFALIARLGGTPESYRNDYHALVATTAEQTQGATRAFDPEAFTFVFVGDKAAIEAQLKKAFPTKTLEWVEVR